MWKQIRTLLINRVRILLSVLFSSVFMARADDGDLIRQQFVEYFVQTSADESSAERNQGTILSDGTWADIDYANIRRGNWPTLNHLSRLQAMAEVYAAEDAALYRSPELFEAVLAGLNHWIEKDYRNPNWWYTRIGVPKALGTVLLLLGEDLPEQTLAAAKPIMMRSEMGMTGQNKVWCAGNNVMIGLLYNNEELIETAVADIWGELQVSTKEGIQPDWSFHQHGHQQQFGNYGMSFVGDMMKWGRILQGSDYALSGEKLEILRNYMLKGVSWIIWHGYMDFSGCGRQIDAGDPQGKGRQTLRQLKAMPLIDPDYSEHYKAVLTRTGFRAFWRSEMGVQRREDWYASVKMSSKRVIGSETCNSENMQGLHLGDGVLLVYRDGSEYEDIVPVWDWKRLPGTTCDQGIENLKPGKLGGKISGSGFSGVLGGVETGIAAMIYERGGLSAHKSFFFFTDHVACLGAGISGETSGSVYTSIEQSWLKGDVKEDDRRFRHNGMVYEVVDGAPVVKSGWVDGDWCPSFPTRGERPVSGEVVSLFVDHGPSPDHATYAYRVYPTGESASVMKSTILSNTDRIQAVMSGDKVYAVFYEAGSLAIGHVRRIEVSGPCLILLSDQRIYVADPTLKLKELAIRVNTKSVNVKLPQGKERGNTVVVDLY